MNAAVVEFKELQLPEPVARRGITEPQWRTMANNLFPGANVNSVLMAWDYCIARRLDPLKKPCHIVPMNVKDAKTGDYSWRDVIMPGIYEYRTTAQRTGEYMGHSIPQYGPTVDFKGVMVPEWCAITIYRWNPLAKLRAEFPVCIEFKEIAATKRNGDLNDRWTTAPKMQLTKCAEAAGLRAGFPDELGGTHTVEEMEGRVIEHTGAAEAPSQAEAYIKRLIEALDADFSEDATAEIIFNIWAELNGDPELQLAIHAKLSPSNRRAIQQYREQHQAAQKAIGTEQPTGKL